ncbi:hypothetical protein NRY68_09370, partial [Acidithiobacillus ferrooxidans]
VSLRESRSPPDTYTPQPRLSNIEAGLFFGAILRMMRKKVGQVPTFCFCAGNGERGRSTV